MVVHNEGKRINSCLLRIIPYVFEVIIVDQESTDNTMTELLKWKRKPKHRFAILTDHCSGICETSRHESLYRAEFNWRLILDADEYLENPDCLQRLAGSDKSTRIFGFRRKNLIDGVEMKFMGDDYQPRLIDSGIIWPTKLHEAPYHPSRKNIQDAVIIHDRSYEEVMSDQERYMARDDANLDDHHNFIRQVNETLGRT